MVNEYEYIESICIPNNEAFSLNYAGGSVEVICMKSIQKNDDYYARLKDWVLHNIVPGILSGEYTRSELIEDCVKITIRDSSGVIVFSTL